MRWGWRWQESDYERRRQAYERAVADAVRGLIERDTSPCWSPALRRMLTRLSDAEIVAVVTVEPLARERGLVGAHQALAEKDIELPCYLVKALLSYIAPGGSKMPPRVETIEPETTVGAFLRELKALADRPVAQLLGA